MNSPTVNLPESNEIWRRVTEAARKFAESPRVFPGRSREESLVWETLAKAIVDFEVDGKHRGSAPNWRHWLDDCGVPETNFDVLGAIVHDIAIDRLAGVDASEANAPQDGAQGVQDQTRRRLNMEGMLRDGAQ